MHICPCLKINDEIFKAFSVTVCPFVCGKWKMDTAIVLRGFAPVKAGMVLINFSVGPPIMGLWSPTARPSQREEPGEKALTQSQL